MQQKYYLVTGFVERAVDKDCQVPRIHQRTFAGGASVW